MTTELEESIINSLYNMNPINPSNINKILVLIENSCKKYKDRVYYIIQYYHIEPIMKNIKNNFNIINPFISELKNTYISLREEERKEWIDRIYNEFYDKSILCM